ncbi:hypothetical protein [Haloarchaeobius sp. HRN-SO-5]|uniref:DUF7837 family putative zinc-binding protein n=1 Tax=Haloarchaeobius sp. HRN-SO-5 TaxID=3446118 RepID=UPI003EBA47F5
MDGDTEAIHMGVRDSAARGRTLGTCSECAASIPQANLVVKYVTPTDWPRILAECPECDAVVHPA